MSCSTPIASSIRCGEYVILRLQLAVLLPQFLLRRRTEDKQQYDETARTQSHPDEQTAQDMLNARCLTVG